MPHLTREITDIIEIDVQLLLAHLNEEVSVTQNDSSQTRSYHALNRKYRLPACLQG